MYIVRINTHESTEREKEEHKAKSFIIAVLLIPGVSHSASIRRPAEKELLGRITRRKPQKVNYLQKGC